MKGKAKKGFNSFPSSSQYFIKKKIAKNKEFSKIYFFTVLFYQVRYRGYSTPYNPLPGDTHPQTPYLGEFPPPKPPSGNQLKSYKREAGISLKAIKKKSAKMHFKKISTGKRSRPARGPGCRGSSIKTRIETLSSINNE